MLLLMFHLGGLKRAVLIPFHFSVVEWFISCPFALMVR